jgi:hypothetical protein
VDIEEPQATKTVEAFDHRAAAECFVESVWSATDHQAAYEVLVRSVGEPNVKHFTVDVVPVPSFEATEIKPRRTTPATPKSGTEPSR